MAACSTDDPLGIGAAQPRRKHFAIATVPSQAGHAPSPDAMFDSIAMRSPGFAGLRFVEGAELEVLHASARVEPRREDVAEELRRGRPDLATRVLTARSTPVRFSWRELSDWARELRTPAMMLNDVVSFDIDEGANSIVIGISSTDGIARVREALRGSSVDRAALRLEVRRPIAMTSGTILGRVRPLSGGTQIGPSGCSMGVVAQWNGSLVLITAAHCSAVPNVIDGEAVKQPASSSSHLGFEVHDEAGWSCYYWTRTCRHADVSAYSLVNPDTLPGETWLVPGRIARTMYRAWGADNLTGSVSIDPLNPYFQLSSMVEFPLQNEYVEKVGVATGWTHGWVYRTCSDEKAENGMMFTCQDLATLNGDPGDSGAPVFWSSALGVKFFGIVWGKEGETGTAFSNVRQIRGDLGAFEVVVPY